MEVAKERLFEEQAAKISGDLQNDCAVVAETFAKAMALEEDEAITQLQSEKSPLDLSALRSGNGKDHQSVHTCAHCLKEIGSEEYFGNDFYCNDCAKNDTAFPWATTM